MLSFKLSDAFVASYLGRPVPWGFTDAAGNSVGELVFLRTYSRIKADGSKETWLEVCRRVVEGVFSIQKDYAKSNRLPWSDRKAAATAQEMFERMFHFKWTPPGRGLWMMGTPLVNEHRNSAALQNCAFVSTGSMTKTDPAEPFAFLMEASMLGIGVGFDTKGAEKNFPVYNAGISGIESRREREPELTAEYVARHTYVIPDTREGWVESVVRLLNSYLKADAPVVFFDYSQIRPAGAPITTFGGTAAGPEPLRRLHEKLREILDRRATFGQDVGMPEYRSVLTSTDILDIGNLIGVCVVSGNVRRSAELALGTIDDEEFLNAKDFAGSAASRAEWGWMSNNSVAVNVGDDLSRVVEGIQRNGEPGVVWMDLSRDYGRLVDPPNGRDHRAAGYNPCAEQTLESFECCTLVETYLNRHENLDDYLRTLKFAFMYAKTVTLLPTHWARTNAIMQRNRRIGTSMSGIANFADRHGLAELRRWMEAGYSTVQHYDTVYSEWLCVRESIKGTTVKPSGTVSILAGESPGAHWAPGGEFFNRRVVFAAEDPLVPLFRWAGYDVEDSVYTPGTSVVVTFPVQSQAKRSEKDVSIFEKANLAATAQRYWSDNSVSVTVSFDPATEGQHVGTVLAMYEGQLKTVSFLPMGGAYAQMPYEEITAEAYVRAQFRLMRVDLSEVYAGRALDAVGEAYCTTDACEVKTPAGIAS
ncbi:ribonucleoside-triphosphate reductase, adenosylcobalamin-dependent [Lentzea sp. JNUCC 0626]|uniref:ribonucleoside-triphosphate reductase, adenosylcobalamin-dependent n=1 Tax=Lentzea sp. JNUCC 0626 TaxID=3367513 RepID=UPI0037480A3F